MAIRIIQNCTAISPGLYTSFGAVGGTSPYTFSVMDGGAGGTIDPATGIYHAPARMSSDPARTSDYIQVIDQAGALATSSILVGNALLLFCDIIKNQMELDASHCYLWDQKLFQPTDNSLYVAVSVPTCKAFGNINRFDASGPGLEAQQSVNMMATLDVDVISRGPEARDRKEEVLMAIYSVYSEQQQEANSFSIGRLPAGSRFLNLSEIDGAAIPYRYKIALNMQYAVTKNLQVPYFNTFQTPSVVTDA